MVSFPFVFLQALETVDLLLKLLLTEELMVRQPLGKRRQNVGCRHNQYNLKTDKFRLVEFLNFRLYLLIVPFESHENDLPYLLCELPTNLHKLAALLVSEHFLLVESLFQILGDGLVPKGKNTKIDVIGLFVRFLAVLDDALGEVLHYLVFEVKHFSDLQTRVVGSLPYIRIHIL